MSQSTEHTRIWGMETEKLATWIRWLLFFLVLFVVKLWVIRQYGSPVPKSDQWDSEAYLLYKPYLEGTLSFLICLSPHNEHRIFFPGCCISFCSKQTASGNRCLEMTVQAAMHSAIIVFFLALCTRGLSGSHRVLSLLVTSPFFLLPFGWENTLSGFQSPFYFVTGFGALAIWLCWLYESIVPAAGLVAFWFASAVFSPWPVGSSPPRPAA